jgi:hypothetical protein
MEQGHDDELVKYILLEDAIEEMRAGDEGNPVVNFDIYIIVNTKEELEILLSKKQ